ncbi:hypothetical protein ACJX0J_013155, partial [Zea mays]
MGTFLVSHHPTKVLFDTSASHTFLNKDFFMHHNIFIQEARWGVAIQSPGIHTLSSLEEVSGRAYSVVVEERVARPLNEIWVVWVFGYVEEHATHLRVCEFWLDQVLFWILVKILSS